MNSDQQTYGGELRPGGLKRLNSLAIKPHVHAILRVNPDLGSAEELHHWLTLAKEHHWSGEHPGEANDIGRTAFMCIALQLAQYNDWITANQRYRGVHFIKLVIHRCSTLDVLFINRKVAYDEATRVAFWDEVLDALKSFKEPWDD